MRIVFIVFCFVLSVNAQQLSDTEQICKERASQIAQSLEPDNALRLSIEQGSKGKCIHQNWMDKLKQFSIKQVSYLIEYTWKNDKVNFKIKGTSYLRFYYSNYDSGAVKDKKLLREIKESGLEQELKDVVLTGLQNSAFAKREKGTVKQDVFEANLLDDEALPVLYMIY